MRGFFVRSEVYDPCENLATEEYLVSLNKEIKAVILYLWINRDTVVIGKNQNAYRECDLGYAENNGIKVVRRLTGGGAVYHDMGNLNYSIITPRNMYDVDRSTKVVCDALHNLGICAEINGRNDLCLNGRKISGNAYYYDENIGLHHGTLLYRIDAEKMERVLRVSEDKLNKHSVRSVRSRVGDIFSNYPMITMDELEEELAVSVQASYDAAPLNRLQIPADRIMVLKKRYESFQWNIGRIREDEEGSDSLTV